MCNAGIARDNSFPAMSGEDWDTVIETNLDGLFNVLNPLTMPLVQRRKPGRIVTLSSVSGLLGNRGQVNYSAAKAGIIGATKALALELAKRQRDHGQLRRARIHRIATEMTESAPAEEILRHVPVRRVGLPEEVAAAVSFLMSADAAYITRQVIAVDGGLS